VNPTRLTYIVLLALAYRGPSLLGQKVTPISKAPVASPAYVPPPTQAQGRTLASTVKARLGARAFQTALDEDAAAAKYWGWPATPNPALGSGISLGAQTPQNAALGATLVAGGAIDWETDSNIITLHAYNNCGCSVTITHADPHRAYLVYFDIASIYPMSFYLRSDEYATLSYKVIASWDLVQHVPVLLKLGSASHTATLFFGGAPGLNTFFIIMNVRVKPIV